MNKGGNVGKDLRRKDKVLITIPRRRRVFQDGIGRWSDILSDHLGFCQKLEKGVPSNDASLSMRGRREAGVKCDQVPRRRRRTRTALIDPARALPPPCCGHCPLDKKKDKKKDNAPLVEAGHKEEGWQLLAKPRELQLFYDLFEDMLGRPTRT